MMSLKPRDSNHIKNNTKVRADRFGQLQPLSPPKKTSPLRGSKEKALINFIVYRSLGRASVFLRLFPSRVIEYILFFIKWGGHTMPARPGVYIIELWLGCKLHYPHTCSSASLPIADGCLQSVCCSLCAHIYESFYVFYFIKTPLPLAFFQRTETTGWRQKKQKRPLTSCVLTPWGCTLELLIERRTTHNTVS